jgi:hypothetical protein
MIRAIRSIPLERVLRCPRIQCMGFEAMKRRWAGVGWMLRTSWSGCIGVRLKTVLL